MKKIHEILTFCEDKFREANFAASDPEQDESFQEGRCNAFREVIKHIEETFPQYFES